MDRKMRVPTRSEALRMLSRAEERHPGPWVIHSRYVAQAAELIAERIPIIDSSTAYVMGLLHDIGRQEGVADLRHTLDGYRFLEEDRYDDAARICLTHSFPVRNVHAGSGQWDCSPEELDFVEKYLAGIEYSIYDHLLQLCDALADPNGFCLVEKRLLDVAIRRGVNDYSIEKWKSFLRIKQEIELMMGCSVYSLLPGVIENTFGVAFDDGEVENR